MRYTSKNSISFSINFVSALLSKVTLDEKIIDDLLRSSGIPKHLLAEPAARVSLVQYAKLLNDLAGLTGDELIGHGKSVLPYGSLSLLTHWLIGAKNLRHATSRISHFFKILGHGLAIHRYTAGKLIYLELDIPTRSQHSFAFGAELCCSNIHRILSWLAMEIIPLDHVAFESATPSYSQDYRLMFYGSPVLFEQSTTRMAFSESILEKPIKQNLNGLENFLADWAFEVLALDFKTDNMASRVAATIRQSLHCMPTLPELAQDLGMEPYTLQRRLAKEDMTYLAIKNQVKRDAAIDMLVNTELSIEDISLKLGFSETSPFTRTFKEWTGIPPSAYRKYH